VIGGAVTFVSFSVGASDRVAGKAGVAATFTFTPTAGGAGPAAVTLSYPSGFFAATATPNATLSTSGATLAPGAPGNTSIVMTVGGAALAASTAVTVTLVGLTISNTPTSGGAVTVQTMIDSIASVSVPSGSIGGSSNLMSFLLLIF
jgi:hypothetical protein